MNRTCMAVTLITAVSLTGRGLAATITQSQGFAGQPSLQENVEFDRFDPKYGELLSAEWQLLLEIQGGVHAVDNDSETPRTVEVYLGARASLQSLDVTLVDTSMQPLLAGESSVTTITSSLIDLAAEDGDGAVFDGTGPDGASHAGKFGSSAKQGQVNTSYLSQYLGTQMFQVHVNVETVASISDSTGIFAQVEPVTAWPSVVLTYEYAPVPEPATSVSLTLGLLALGIVARRRDASCLRSIMP